MAAVIRVKRPFTDEPLDAFILNCKRRKLNEETENESPKVSTILKFAGTINSQEEDIFKHLKKPSKSDLEEQFKKHIVDINSKLKLEKQLESKNNRYKVVNCFRSQQFSHKSNEASSVEAQSSEVTILDIETDINQNCNKNDLNELKYVYDLYYTASDDLGEAQLGEDVNIYPLSESLMYGSFRDNGLKNNDDSSDSEDSNAENYWKNDYPDESDMESINEDDMANAMTNLDLENSLSSDDGEEGFVYSIDSEGAGFEEDIDNSDVQRYGERYAVFKARHKKKSTTTDGFSGDLYYGDIDDEVKEEY